MLVEFSCSFVLNILYENVSFSLANVTQKYRATTLITIIILYRIMCNTKTVEIYVEHDHDDDGKIRFITFTDYYQMELKFSRPLSHIWNPFTKWLFTLYANIDFTYAQYEFSLHYMKLLKRFIQKWKYLVNYYVPFIGTSMCFRVCLCVCVSKHRNSHLITLH